MNPTTRETKLSDWGLLLMRIGLGIMFVTHGYPKLFGGPEAWKGIGAAMGIFGITFAPAFWGFMAAFAEFFGGIFLALGLALRPYCVMLTITMVVASAFHLNRGDGLAGASHAIELGIVFVSLALIGAGNLSLDALCCRKSSGR
jgi:putative oxidoreductase